MNKELYESLLEERARVAKQLQAIDRLIGSAHEEGKRPKIQHPYRLTTLEDREAILSHIKGFLLESGNRPIHPRVFVTMLAEKEIAVAGKNPASTVAAFLSRNKEFTRAGTAGYHLTNAVVKTGSEAE